MGRHGTHHKICRVKHQAVLEGGVLCAFRRASVDGSEHAGTAAGPAQDSLAAVGEHVSGHISPPPFLT